MSQPYDPQNPASYPPPPGGLPGQPVPPAAGYPPAYPASAPPYAYPASPYAVHPASAAPAYAYPASAPPAYPGYPTSAPPVSVYPYPVSATPASIPGYPPPPGYPGAPATGGRRNMALFIIVGVGVLLAAIVGVALLNRGGSNTGTPEATANAYFAALQRGDIGEMRALSCSELQWAFDELESGEGASGWAAVVSMMRSVEMEFRITGSSLEGDVATVNYTISITFMGQSTTDAHAVRLVRESGGWRVCSDL